MSEITDFQEEKSQTSKDSELIEGILSLGHPSSEKKQTPQTSKTTSKNSSQQGPLQ